MTSTATAGPTSPVATGLLRLCSEPALLPALRYGLVTNATAVTAGLQPAAPELLRAGVRLAALFGPEHGLHGTAQAGYADAGVRDEATGLTVHDTYLLPEADLDERIAAAGAEGLIFDMQDIGTRCYTYVWTMFDTLRAAGRAGIPFVVLDRPNPLSGAVCAGPGLDGRFASFVGREDIPLRHGLTLGELARLFHRRLQARGEATAQLRVIELRGWDPAGYFEASGLPWVPPSPNMPTIDTALAYCGTALFEGTTASEGRGTTTPFRLIGAPWVDGALAARLRARGIPGALVRDAWFTPMFHKHAGLACRGVELHITDRAAFDPIRFALELITELARLYPEDFSFLVPGERVDSPEAGFAVDRLWGSDTLRTTIEAGDDALTLLPATATPQQQYPEGVLLYPRPA